MVYPITEECSTCVKAWVYTCISIILSLELSLSLLTEVIQLVFVSIFYIPQITNETHKQQAHVYLYVSYTYRYTCACCLCCLRPHPYHINDTSSYFKFHK